MEKLSKKLIEILNLMDTGKWQLRRGHDGMWWLAKNNGEFKFIHGRTDIYKLVKEGLIASNGYSFPTIKYHLTKKAIGR